MGVLDVPCMLEVPALSVCARCTMPLLSVCARRTIPLLSVCARRTYHPSVCVLDVPSLFVDRLFGGVIYKVNILLFFLSLDFDLRYLLGFQ